MNKGFLIIGIVVMTLFGFFAISLITSQQTGSELDYYLLKDTTEAAMNDALDYNFYSEYGLVRMDKEKFAENFIKRFADGVDATRKYTIEFYDMNEVPPKVSVRVKSNSNAINKKAEGDITTQVDMIIESNNEKDTWTKNYSSKNNITSTKNLNGAYQ